MEEYEVRKRRDFGTNPYPNIVYFTPEDDFVITKTLKEIVEEDNLLVLAYNICGDHIHLLLVCELDEIPRIMQKIKAVTSKNVRIARERSTHNTREHAPLQGTYLQNAPLRPAGNTTREYDARNTREQDARNTREQDARNTREQDAHNTREHAPLRHVELRRAPLQDTNLQHAPLRKVKKKNKPLWQQKYSAPKEITSTEQLTNTLNYIKGNRSKHELEPHPKKTQELIHGMLCTYTEAFKPEYTGGFDVVIGNPPYLRKQGLVEHYPKMVEYYEQNFISATSNYDIYALFMERSYGLINQYGITSFILPHKFLIADFGLGIRKFFKEKTAVNNLVHFGSEIVFTEAATYTCIIDLTKTRKEKLRFKKLKPEQLFDPFVWESMKYEKLTTKNWDLQSEEVVEIIEKLEKQPQTIDSVFDKIFQGIATSLDAVYVFQGEEYGNFIKGYNEKYDYHFEIEKEMVKPIFGGRDIFKYDIPEISNYVIFPYILSGDESTPMDESYIKKNLPKAYAYLKHFEKEIRGRERGRMDIEEGWFLYIYPKNLPYFQNPKIMTREISLGCNMTYDENGEFYHNTKVYSFVKKDSFEVDEKYYLGILNSKVMWFFLKNTGSEYRGGYYVFKTNYLKPFPLPEISSNAQEIINLVNEILAQNKDFSSKTEKFQNYLLSQYPVEKLSKKLQNWHELDFGDFIKELNKAINKENRARRKNEQSEIPKLTKKNEFEWMELFEDNKKKAVELQTEINRIDNQIDQMVYELYGLTEEEIKIVENTD
ncbi:Eco57I restriction-modification methylase domain-containing protein [Haloflavibacter putidus]|uniref:site-specific DNA-methyltransferase (adenine-specific) n=2 Tax=Haloflavibacter putidus TaxID=2576776 RepID=A0A508A0Q9_9FLAO|nr:hypothetical protein FKR84_05815 [Haloflavibacter putidus]